MIDKAVSRQRNFGLDIARCMAVSLVFIPHSLLNIYTREIPFLWYGVFTGLGLFFSLSGFLIGRILFDMFSRHAGALSVKPVARFWIRRWFRTLPLYFILYFVFLFIYNNWVYPVHADWHFLFFLQNMSSRPYGFFGESWSLSIEEWFYLVAPLLLYFAYKAFYKKTGRAGRNNIIFIATALFIILAQIIFRRICPDCSPWDCFAVLYRFDAIAYGLAGAYASKYITGMNQKKALWMMAAGAIFCLAAALVKIKLFHHGYLAQLFFPFDGIGTTLLVMGLYYYPFKKHYSAVRYTSKISYSIYLTHLTGIIVPLLWWTRNTALKGTLLLWLIAVIITLLLSGLTYQFIEKPFMSLRERWFPSQ